jgi:hypothetical protein
MTNNLYELQSELQAINLSFERGLTILCAVVEEAERTHDDPQGSGLHFAVEILKVQRRKLEECIGRVVSERLTVRNETATIQRMLDISGRLS